MATALNVLESVGVKAPTGPAAALAMLLLRRAILRLKRLRFTARDESQIPPSDLKRLDACLSIGTSVGPVNVLLGSALNARALADALRVGEPVRLCVALGMEIVFVSMAGSRAPKRLQRLIALQREAAEQANRPMAWGWVHGSQGIAAYYQGKFNESLEKMREAERLWRDECTGAVWELATARNFLCWSLFHTGRFRELAQLVPAYVSEAANRGDLYTLVNLQLGLPAMAWLIPDTLEEARSRATAAMAHWARPGFDVQHWYELTSAVHDALYAGEPEQACEWIRHRWRPLFRSLLPRVQMVRVEAYWLRARAALAAALTSPKKMPKLQREALKMARHLRREGLACARGLAALVEAATCAQKGQTAKALGLLEEATTTCAGLGMTLLATLARLRRAELEKNLEAARAEMEVLSKEGIVKPEKIAGLLTPGFAATGD